LPSKTERYSLLLQHVRGNEAIQICATYLLLYGACLVSDARRFPHFLLGCVSVSGRATRHVRHSRGLAPLPARFQQRRVPERQRSLASPSLFLEFFFENAFPKAERCREVLLYRRRAVRFRRGGECFAQSRFGRVCPTVYKEAQMQIQSLIMSRLMLLVADCRPGQATSEQDKRSVTQLLTDQARSLHTHTCNTRHTPHTTHTHTLSLSLSLIHNQYSCVLLCQLFSFVKGGVCERDHPQQDRSRDAA
jgi:hypothetical protein